MQHPENLMLLFSGIAEFFIIVFALVIYFLKRGLKKSAMKSICEFLFGSAVVLAIIIAMLAMAFLSAAG